MTTEHLDKLPRDILNLMNELALSHEEAEAFYKDPWSFPLAEVMERMISLSALVDIATKQEDNLYLPLEIQFFHVLLYMMGELDEAHQLYRLARQYFPVESLISIAEEMMSSMPEQPSPFIAKIHLN